MHDVGRAGNVSRDGTHEQPHPGDREADPDAHEARGKCEPNASGCNPVDIHAPSLFQERPRGDVATLVEVLGRDGGSRSRPHCTGSHGRADVVERRKGHDLLELLRLLAYLTMLAEPARTLTGARRKERRRWMRDCSPCASRCSSSSGC